MKRLTLIAIIVVCLLIGVIIGWIGGLGVLNNLQGVGFVLAGLAFGLVLGFILDWLIEESYRRNRELEQQLLVTQQPATRVAPQSVPVSIPVVNSEGSEIASQALAETLRKREQEIAKLQAEIEETEQKADKVQDIYDAYIKTHPDDLTVIKGIGSVFQWKLRDIGINTFQQLAEADKDQIYRMLDVKNWQRVDIDAWMAQARDWASRDHDSQRKE